MTASRRKILLSVVAALSVPSAALAAAPGDPPTTRQWSPNVRPRELPKRPVAPQAPPPAPGAPYPVSQADFARLLGAVEAARFSGEQLRLLTEAAATQYFLVSQVLEVLRRLPMAEDKLRAVRVLWPRVLDRDNGYQLYGAFSFNRDKEQLRQILGQ